MKVVVLVCVVLVASVHGTSKETFRGRLNPAGAQAAQNLIREMIKRRDVNDLMKKAVVGNVPFNFGDMLKFHISELNTGDVTIGIKPNNRLGFSIRNAAVKVQAHYSIPLLFFTQRGTIVVTASGVSGTIESTVGVSGGRLHSSTPGCSLHLSHLSLNSFFNLGSLVKGVVADMACQGIKKFGKGMIDSVFETLPTNIDVFDLFRLEFPMVNFKSWDQHLVAGLGMEVRPINNLAVSYDNIRLLAIPEMEDGHMACASISDFVINTASRTFLPIGTSFDVDIQSVMSLVMNKIFPIKMVLRGTVAAAPMFQVEKDEIVFSVDITCVMLDKNGNVSPFSKPMPMTISVRAPANETPLFNKVKIEVKGPIPISQEIDLATVLDYIVSQVDSLFASSGKRRRMMVKRATGADLSRAVREMFVGYYLPDFTMKLSAQHGALIACASGTPNENAKRIIVDVLRHSLSK